MNSDFPSREFDDAVAAVCHGVATNEQVRALSELLRQSARARDEYILRVELHSRLASEPDLFVSAAPETLFVPSEREHMSALTAFSSAVSSKRESLLRKPIWVMVAAACLTLLAAAGWWTLRFSRSASSSVTTSKAVAMLSQTVAAQWNFPQERPRLGAPLDPGWLKLDGGLAQVVFYSGARVVIEGPAEIQLISPNHASFRLGKIVAEVPPEARGFRLDTPQGAITDLGTSFGVRVEERGTELHVFKGTVTLRTPNLANEQVLREGAAAAIDVSGAIRPIAANRTAYASLFDLREKSLAVDALRLERWRISGDVLNRDPSLRVRFDFEHSGPSVWRLRNVAQAVADLDDATIIGCQFTRGRWADKRAMEFQNVNDRVRMNVPGAFGSVTLSAWVRVQGLDRKLNSLFMCDGFSAGTLHWLIRNDGVLGLTIVGTRAGDYQLAISPSVVSLDKFGMWLHLAVVVDGRTRRVAHYVNGRPVAELELRIPPPYRIGPAELGNWDGKGFPEKDPFMIRNFSGAMDDFCLFSRALDAREIQTLYEEGKPDLEAVALRE